MPSTAARDAAAAVVADDHDVLHLDDVDRELQHGEVVRVLRRREVGDVAVDEELAGIEVDDLVRRHAAVGAADPEIFRRLLAHEPPEEARIGGFLRAAQARLFAFRCSSMRDAYAALRRRRSRSTATFSVIVEQHEACAVAGRDAAELAVEPQEAGRRKRRHVERAGEIDAELARDSS